MAVIFAFIMAFFCAIDLFAGNSYESFALKMLDSGDFEGFNNMLADKRYSMMDKHRYMAWFLLYTGEYSKGLGILGAAKKDDFLFRYLSFMSSIEKSFSEVQSEHFKVRYFPPDEIMADFAVEALEKIYVKNGELLGYFPPDKIVVEIYPDKNSFAMASTLGLALLEKSGTVGICKFNRIMLLSPRNLPLGYRWLDTLSHEYCHLLINRITRNNAPLWLHEGVSRYTDTLWRLDKSNYLSDYSAKMLKEAVQKNSLIPFKKMSPSLVFLPTQEDISLAFAQVASFVDFFVQKYGQGALKKWLEYIAVLKEKESFRKVSKVSFESIERKWKGSIAAGIQERISDGVPDTPKYGAKSEEEFLSIDSIGHVRLGDILRRQGSFESALIQYQKAYDSDRSPVIAVKIAKVKMAIGNIDAAQALMEELIKGNENYITPYLLLREISLGRGEKKKASFYAHEAFSINPFYPGLYDIVKSMKQ